VSIILIGAPERLQALKQREDYSAAQTFADSEALRALEVITRRRPDVVALERAFAATARGTALINRIKADPKLASCEIRVVAHDSTDVQVIPARQASTRTAAAAPQGPPSDRLGTRRAPRFRAISGVEVTVDGNAVTLVNLSVIGAQVTSPAVLRPNQRVRFTLADGKGQIRIGALVGWAVFEFTPAGPQYRAGLEFVDADADAVQRYCDATAESPQTT